ncbi:unnamed protein product [Ectocarpus fasciculatus]
MWCMLGSRKKQRRHPGRSPDKGGGSTKTLSPPTLHPALVTATYKGGHTRPATVADVLKNKYCIHRWTQIILVCYIREEKNKQADDTDVFSLVTGSRGRYQYKDTKRGTDISSHVL